MQMKPTIIILYEKAHSENIAQAFRRQIEAANPDKYILAISDKQFIKNDFAKLRRKMRQAFVRHFPSTELFFSQINHLLVKRRLRKQRNALKKEDHLETASNAEKLLNGHLRYVKNIYMRYNPEMIICMSPYCLHMATATRNLLGIDLSIAAYVPDMCLDENFVDYYCQGYYVLNTDVRSALMKYGISEERINVAGYPPCPQHDNRTAIAEKLELDNTVPTILFSGGEGEKHNLLPYFESLIDSCTHYNLIVDTTGVKTKRIEKACDLCPAREHVHTISGVPFDELLTVSDILVATPETDRLFLAFGYNKPVIITPAQTLFQRKIVDYVDSHDIALIGDTTEHFSDMLLDKLEELTAMQDMTRRAALLVNATPPRYAQNSALLPPDGSDETVATDTGAIEIPRKPKS